MYSSKKTVLETVSLLKAHGIKHLVLSPGSRNAPLIQSFINDPFFTCYSVVDERSASYMAIGMIQQLMQPVALCCTSGTALLNYGPAIAEACYQHLPLVVLSADRSQAWIHQMDGQTIPQQNLFDAFMRTSVQLPDITDEESRWHCNRLINEALVSCLQGGGGPVHLNIPLSEPLFDFSVAELPEARVIRQNPTLDARLDETLFNAWKSAEKRMILVGQLPVSAQLNAVLDTLVQRCGCVVLCEHLSNTSSERFIRNADVLLGLADEQTRSGWMPDLLITLGGHVVSKRLKKWLRTNHGIHQWHISQEGKVADTYQCLREVITGDPTTLLGQLAEVCQPSENQSDYAKGWETYASAIPTPSHDLPFSDLSVTCCLLEHLPADATLFVANSSPVRNIQYYKRPAVEKIVCNRGTNGIEGCVSTAMGLSLLNEKLTVALMGDLSFFHDLSGLWNPYFSPNLRLLLINNGGGGIFHQLDGLTLSSELESYVAANHGRTAEKWVEAANLTYLKATNTTELTECLVQFTRPGLGKGVVLEVMTSPALNKEAISRHLSDIKQAII